MVKNIIQRIVVGVGIALALMFLKGGLIGNVYAKTESFGSGGQYYQSLENYEIVANISEAPFKNLNPGYLTFSVSIWNWSTQIQQTQYSQVLANIYATANGGKEYACSFTGVSNSKALEEAQGYLYNEPLTASYSVSCYIEPGTTGLTQIRAYGFGIDSKSNWRINSPITFTESDYATISNSTQNIDNSINDSSVDNSKTESDISSMNSKLASNNSITQLLTLPIQLYQNILNGINGSCSSFSLGTLYNHSITLPCINLENLLGSTLYGIIDILCSGLFILSFRKKMVDIFNHMTSLNDRGNEVE